MLELIKENDNKDKHLNLKYLLSEASGVELNMEALNFAFCGAAIFEQKIDDKMEYKIPPELETVDEVIKFSRERLEIISPDNRLMNFKFFNLEDLHAKGGNQLIAELFHDLINTSLLCDNTIDCTMDEDYFIEIINRVYTRLKNEKEDDEYFKYTITYTHHQGDTHLYDLETFNLMLTSFGMKALVGEAGTAKNKLSIRGFLKEFQETFEVTEA